MPRNPSGIYTKPFPDVVSGTTIESAVHNGTVNDVELDLNVARPIVAGGTGSSTAAGARTNLQAERAMQVVTDYNAHVFETGSLYSAPGATAAPDAISWFAGTVQVMDANSTFVQVRRLGDGKVFERQKASAVWGAWQDAGAPGDFVKKAGDVMSGDLTLTKYRPSIILNKNGTLDASNFALLTGQVNGVNQWQISLVDALGAPATDHNFAIYRYNNAGAFLNAPVHINRTTGNIALVDGGGAVGIGTTSPQARLHVKSNTNVNLWVTEGAAGFNRFVSINDAVSAFVPLQIDASPTILGMAGNVGIGTTNPGVLLDVGGNTAAGVIRLGNTAGGSVFEVKNANLANGSGNYASLNAMGGLGIAVLWNGYVGIGTTGPSHPLHLVGATPQIGIDATGVTEPGIHFKRSSALLWSFQVGADNILYVRDGDYSAGVSISQNATAWAAFSDVKVKNINGRIEGAAAKVASVDTVYFTYKDDATSTPHVGFLAHQWKAFAPETVSNSEGGLLLRYTETIPYVVAAWQEDRTLVQQRLAAIEAKLETLQ